MKTKEMENFLSGFTSQMFKTNYTECKNNNQCVICGGVADKFTDDNTWAIGVRISAMCQTCQDNTFGD